MEVDPQVIGSLFATILQPILCVHTQTRIYTHAHTKTRMHTRMPTHIHAGMRTHIHTHKNNPDLNGELGGSLGSIKGWETAGKERMSTDNLYDNVKVGLEDRCVHLVLHVQIKVLFFGDVLHEPGEFW